MNKNYYVYGTVNELNALAEEYRDYCGRDVKLEEGRLCVLALPPVKPKKKREEKPNRREKTDDNS